MLWKFLNQAVVCYVILEMTERPHSRPVPCHELLWDPCHVTMKRKVMFTTSDNMHVSEQKAESATYRWCVSEQEKMWAEAAAAAVRVGT